MRKRCFAETSLKSPGTIKHPRYSHIYGVVRFLDTQLLPASAPSDYPKVIKSGVDEEGQHPKSPTIEAQCGLATLLYRMNRMDILEKLLDAKAVEEFEMRMYTDEKYLQEIYLRRTGYNIEEGFIGSDGEEARHGVRFRIVEEPEGSPLRFGKWLPLSTSDLGADWGGTDSWVHAQAASIAKAIILHKYWRNKLSASFSGHKKEMDERNFGC